jgi:cytochrome oxidase assembly protein ShyY1
MNKQFLIRVAVSGFITILVIGFTSALGLWQFSQSERVDIQNEVLNASPVALSQIHKPETYVQESTFARRVTLQGTLSCKDSLDLRSKTIKGRLCVFENSNDLPIVVFLGNTSTTQFEASPLKIQGRLQPAQSYEPLALGQMPKTSLTELNIHALVHHYKQSLYDGFVIVQSVTSDTETLDVSFDEKLLILPPAGIDIRSLFYAWQWWIFSGFALLLWVKYVRDEWRKHTESL